MPGALPDPENRRRERGPRGADAVEGVGEAEDAARFSAPTTARLRSTSTLAATLASLVSAPRSAGSEGLLTDVDRARREASADRGVLPTYVLGLSGITFH